MMPLERLKIHFPDLSSITFGYPQISFIPRVGEFITLKEKEYIVKSVHHDWDINLLEVRLDDKS